MGDVLKHVCWAEKSIVKELHSCITGSDTFGRYKPEPNQLCLTIEDDDSFARRTDTKTGKNNDVYDT
jgi:hypothetical protein